jgi:hypothetical protein
MVGAPGFEPGTSSPPDWRANQAAPRPAGQVTISHAGFSALASGVEHRSQDAEVNWMAEERRSPLDELTDEELEAQAGEELPDRTAMSVAGADPSELAGLIPPPDE